MRNNPGNRLPSREVVTAFAGGFAEWLFAAVPLLVLSIVLGHRKNPTYVLDSAEWAFGASVLASQGLVRFVSGLIKARHLAVDRVLLGVSAILVFVVVPANIVLVLVLLDHEELIDKVTKGVVELGHLTSTMVTAQVGLFVVASILFIVVAALGHLWARQARE